MTTEKVVKEPVSIEEPVSTTKSPEEVEEKVESQPLTEERVQQLIAEATQKATQEAIEMGKSLGKREMQAIKDREVAQVKRQADILERRAKAYETGFSDLDEDSRARLETRKLQSENEYFKIREQEEEARRQQEVYFERLNQSLKNEVTSMGIDPSDSRIDYATDAGDYFEGRKRFTDSLAKIVRAEKESLEKTTLQKAEERFKELEVAFRKEHGLDLQDTTTSAGVVNQSDADFMAAWGAYELPDNKENRARYEEIKKKFY